MLLGVFQSAGRADAICSLLRESARQRLIRVISLTQIKRDARGRLELLEVRSVHGTGREVAGSLPAIFRMLLGPSDRVSVSARLSSLADALEPDTSAIAALIEHSWVDDVRALMEEAGVEAVTDAVRTEIADAMASGRDLVFTAGATEWRAAPLERLLRTEASGVKGG
jgi:hypothetical protein